jgi:integrase/recombinase XerD
MESLALRQKTFSLPVSLPMTGIPTYDSHIKKFNESKTAINPTDIKDYLNSFTKTSTKSNKKAALKKSLKEVSEKLNDLESLRLIDKVFSGIKFKADKKVYKDEILSKNNIDLLIQSSNPRLSLIIEILFATGLRVSELVGIKVKEDIEIKEGYVFINVNGKGSKERRVFIPEELYKRILPFSGKYLFENRNQKAIDRKQLWRDINQLGKSVLSKDIHPHTFRHSFATYMIVVKKKTVKAVSEYLGHASTSITQDMYLHDELKPNDIFGE